MAASTCKQRMALASIVHASGNTLFIGNRIPSKLRHIEDMISRTFSYLKALENAGKLSWGKLLKKTNRISRASATVCPKQTSCERFKL